MLTTTSTGTGGFDVNKETFDFLGHRFAVRPSKRTGAVKTYYYPRPKAMKAVKK